MDNIKQKKLLLLLGLLFLISGCFYSNSQDNNLQKISKRNWPKADFIVLSSSGRYLGISEGGDKDFGSIYSIDLFTGEILLIAETEPFQGMLYVGDYSKDEKELLIWALGGPEYKSGSWLFDISKPSKPIFMTDHTRPMWTPNGEIITFDKKGRIISLYLNDPDSGIESRIYSAEANTIVGYSISPDGKRIVFSQDSPLDYHGDILILDLASGKVDEILLDGDNFFPDWSPVGNCFVYQHWYDGKQQIRIHNLDQDCDISLSNLNQIAWNPIWNSDGTGLLFISSGKVYSYNLSPIFGGGDPKNWNMCQ
jgi:Tol biopolymer transport system component